MWKRGLFILLLILSLVKAFSQPCTKDIAQSLPAVLDKGINGKPFSATDAVGIKLGNALYPVFETVLKTTTGLHGQFDIIKVSHNPLKGLSGYTAYAIMFKVYCKKGGGTGWEGLYHLEFYCLANDLSSFGKPVNNDEIRMSDSHYIFVDNQIVYRLKPRKLSSEIAGYAYTPSPEAASWNEEVLITKKGLPLFLPITRRDYLMLMRKNAQAQMAIIRKSVADYIKTRIPADTKTWEEHLKCCMTVDEKGWMKSWTDFLPKHPEAQIKFDKEMAAKKLSFEKEKTQVEDGLSMHIANYENDIKEVDALLAANDATYLNKPCITSHSLETLGGMSFRDEKDYFFDDYGVGNAWTIINPAYVNKSLLPSVPQFFIVGWRQGENDVEKKAVIAFKEKFDFKNLQQILSTVR